jgi:hypothetical protein
MLRDVRDFVRKHGSELRLALCKQNQPGVHADVAARQRECVDLRVRNAEELEILLDVLRRGDEAVAELVQVVVDFRIVDVGAAGAVAMAGFGSRQ